MDVNEDEGTKPSDTHSSKAGYTAKEVYPEDQLTDSSDPNQEHNPLNKRRNYLLPLLIIVLVIAGAVDITLANRHSQTNNSSVKTSTNAAATTKNPSSLPSQTQVANSWKGTVNPTAVPLGDGHVSSSPEVGYVDSCVTSFNGGGGGHAGSWLNSAGGTWNSNTKTVVEGYVTWPNASYSVTTNSTSRIITTNDLPENEPTGNFPIATTDPAYQYDHNPNHIAAQNLSYTLPLNPTAAASPSCTRLGAIGVLSDGVVLFNALDDAGRDAGAHELQDSCNGHPDQSSEYHYHTISSCLLNKASGSSTLVGYALDGYGIYVERDSKGNLPTNADLDSCHGRTSEVMWNGQITDIYHYDATLEYPYTIGCYHGTPVTTQQAGSSSKPPGNNRPGQPAH